jgi:hypothetical protein
LSQPSGIEDSLVVARRLRDKAVSPTLREYWQRVVDSIERRRAEEGRKS